MSVKKALSKHATTLVLSGLAIAAAAVVFVVDRGSVTTDEAESRKKNLFVAWRADEITSVTIEQGGSTGTLSRGKPDAHGQRGWEITLGDQRFTAEEQRADQLLGSLEFATSERVLSPGSVDEATLGLASPRLRFRVTSNDGRTSTLEIGGPASSPKGAVHAAVDQGHGRVLHVVNAELVAALDVDPASLRSTEILPFPTSDITRLEIDRAGGGYHLERPAGSPFELRLAGPTKLAGLRVSRRAAEDLLAALDRADAESFLADDVAARASSPTLTLTLIPSGAEPQKTVLVFGGACPDKPDAIVVRGSGGAKVAAACVSKETLLALDKPDADLVDRGPFFATLDEVEEFTLTRGAGDQALELARKGSGFHVRKPVDKDVENDTGRALLEPLLALRAASVVKDGDKPALGLDPPRGEIRLISLRPSRAPDGGDDDLTEKLLLGEPKGDVLPVLRVSDGAILSFPLPAARAFSPNKTALRSPLVIDAPETAVTGIRVEEGSRIQRIERTAEGGWKLVEPSVKGLSADIGLGTDLAAALCPLHAERFAADHDDGSFGLERPRFTIELDLGKRSDAGAGPLRLLLGAPTDRGSFARIEGDDAVFVVDKRVEAAAGRWLLDRAPFSFDLGDIVKVTIAARDAKKPPVVLERAAGVLRVASDPKDTTRAASYREALADLVPEGAVSVGPPRKEQGLDPPAVTLTIERASQDAADTKEPPSIDSARTIRIELGQGDAFRGTAITYARLAGVPATYAIPQSKTRVFMDADR